MEVLIAEIQKRNVLWNKRNPRYKDRLVVDKEWEYVAESVGFTKEEVKKKWRNLRDQFAKELKKIPKPKSGDPVPDYPGKWQYFSDLLFLKDTFTPRNTESNIPNIGLLETVVHDAPTISEESDLDNKNSDISSDEETENANNIERAPMLSRSGTPGESSNTPLVCTKLFIPQRLQTNIQSSFPTSTSSHSKRKKMKGPKESVERQLLEIESKKLAFLDKPEDDDLMFLKSLLPYFKQMHPIQKLRIRSKFQNIIIEEMTHPLLSVHHSSTNSTNNNNVFSHINSLPSNTNILDTNYS